MIYAVRSYGQPYFGAAQAVVQSNEMPGTGGEWSAKLVFRLDGVPVKLSTVDEIHPLFAYSEFNPAGKELMYIGVTPSLRLVAGINPDTGPADGTLASAPGLLSVGTRYEASLLFSGGGGFQLSLGTNAVASGTKAFSVFGPATLCQMLLFNGRLARTRVACAIYEALLGNENESYEWLPERGGNFTTGPSGDFPNTDFTMRPDWIAAADGSHPWGAPPQPNIHSAYRVDRVQEWTPRALPNPSWRTVTV